MFDSVVRCMLVDWVLHHFLKLVVVMNNWLVRHMFLSVHMVVDWLLLDYSHFVFDWTIVMSGGVLGQEISSIIISITWVSMGGHHVWVVVHVLFQVRWSLLHDLSLHER